jgi:diketogulonate reductase-like aldo/keto reductase
MAAPVHLLFTVAATAPVPSVQLQNGVLEGTDVFMPVLAAGTAGYSGANASEAVGRALSAGFPHIHTALDYFNLKDVGKALAKVPRSSFFISSMTPPCIHAAPPARNVTSVEACYNLTNTEAISVLHDLKLASLDLLMLHGPSEPFGHIGGCSPLACQLNRAQWRAYQALLQQGLVRSIGVSNFCASCLACLGDGGPGSGTTSSAVPAVNQVQVHVGQGSADPGPGLLSYCADRNIVVQSYEPLAGGALATDTFCAAIGLKHNKSAAQVALKWVLQRAPSLAVRAGSVAHLSDDLDMFDFSLDGSDLEGLDAQHGPPGEAGGRCSWGCTE